MTNTFGTPSDPTFGDGQPENLHQALQIRTAQLTLAQELAGMASWEWKLSESEIRWSPEMYRFWGFEPGEITVTLDKVAELTHPEDLPVLQSAVMKVTQGEAAEIEYRRFDKNGREIYIRTKTMILRDKDGKPVSVFGIDMDISSVKKAEKLMEEKNRELSSVNAELSSFNFVAGHDLKEPLRKIKTFASRIIEADGEKISEKSKHYFERIENAVNRMQHLIDALLDYSRMQEGEKINFTTTNLNDVLDDVLGDLSETIAEKNARIESTILPEISVLPSQIVQLFTNLISNSLKYSHAQRAPVIEITCQKQIIDINAEGLVEGPYWEITFKDNGIGFEQEYESRIFEIFQRLHSRSDYEGTGIGLAICKKIARNHKGTIRASGQPGRGAQFIVYLPVDRLYSHHEVVL